MARTELIVKRFKDIVSTKNSAPSNSSSGSIFDGNPAVLAHFQAASG